MTARARARQHSRQCHDKGTLACPGPKSLLCIGLALLSLDSDSGISHVLMCSALLQYHAHYITGTSGLEAFPKRLNPGVILARLGGRACVPHARRRATRTLVLSRRMHGVLSVM